MGKKQVSEVWKSFASNGAIKYEASDMGRFRRIGKTKINYLKPYFRTCIEGHRNRPHSVIIKITQDGKPKEYNCKNLLAKLFIRDLKENEVVITKNNNSQDLRISNLFITTRQNLGSITGGKSSRSKKIYYYDNAGYRTSYPSARNLAKVLGVSYQTVLNVANGKTKKTKYKIEWCDNND